MRFTHSGTIDLLMHTASSNRNTLKPLIVAILYDTASEGDSTTVILMPLYKRAKHRHSYYYNYLHVKLLSCYR